jgi:transposase
MPTSTSEQSRKSQVVHSRSAVKLAGLLSYLLCEGDMWVACVWRVCGVWMTRCVWVVLVTYQPKGTTPKRRTNLERAVFKNRNHKTCTCHLVAAMSVYPQCDTRAKIGETTHTWCLAEGWAGWQGSEQR